jgi:hypothetical protein
MPATMRAMPAIARGPSCPARPSATFARVTKSTAADRTIGYTMESSPSRYAPARQEKYRAWKKPVTARSHHADASIAGTARAATASTGSRQRHPIRLA